MIIVTCCNGDVSVWTFKTMSYSSAEADSEPNQATKVNHFATIVSDFKYMLLFLKQS